jgi:hypothetical protein
VGGIPRAKAFGDAFYKVSLTAAERAAYSENLAAFQLLAEPAAEVDGLGGASW